MSDAWSDKQGYKSSGAIFSGTVLDLKLGSSGNVLTSGVRVLSVDFTLGVLTISFYIIKFLEQKT